MASVTRASALKAPFQRQVISMPEWPVMRVIRSTAEAKGEQVKNDPQHLDAAHALIRDAALCRHSYVIAIGGGALLDLAGYAAATAHRGVRLIRVPTTVLSQDDSAVGVKNGVNAYGKKNYFGTFAAPFAVLNDPPSGTHKAGSAHHRRPDGGGWVWAGVAVVLLAAAAVALWLVLGSTPGKTTPTQPATKTKSGR